MTRFHRALKRLFPTRSAKRLERFFGMGQRHAQYVASGREEPAEEMADQLEAQVVILESTQFDVKLGELIEAARAEKLDVEVIAAALADAHETVLDRAID